MRHDVHAEDAPGGASEARLHDLAPGLEELEQRLRSGITRHPAAALAIAAFAGVSLAFVPRRLALAGLALGARALTPLALRPFAAALFERDSHEPQRRT